MSSSMRVPARLQPILMGALVLSLAVASGTAYGATYEVFDDAGLAPLLAHDWGNPSVGLQPGDEVIVRGGTYSAAMEISAQGTAELPIWIHALSEDPNGPPILNNTVAFDAATHVIVDGLTITGCPSTDGVTFVNGATANTIKNADVSYCAQGIAVFAGGASNVISNNVVHHNSIQGIALNETANANYVGYNEVHHNGEDGIVTNGDNTLIEHNTSYTNGQVNYGTSGIRVYAGGYLGAPATGHGQNNVIRYNVVYGNSDHAGPADGNGIQLDLYAANNQVYFNVVEGNDGCGIILFGAESNWVFNNTVYHNGVDTLRPSADLAIVGSTSLATGPYSGVSINNIIANNLIASTAGIPSIDVEVNSVSNVLGNQLIVPDGSNAINNVVVNDLGQVLTAYTTLTAWNTAKGQTPDIASDPLFYDAASVAPTVNPGKNLSLASTSSPAYQTGLSPLTLPTPITVSVDLWQAFINSASPGIDPFQPSYNSPSNISSSYPPIGAYTVDP